MEEIASSFLLFKKKEEGKFWKFLYVYAFGIEEGVFPSVKVVFLKANFTLNAMVYTLSMRLLEYESLCVGKRGKLVVMFEKGSLLKFMFIF